MITPSRVFFIVQNPPKIKASGGNYLESKAMNLKTNFSSARTLSAIRD
jgi:hypothetical protein